MSSEADTVTEESPFLPPFDVLDAMRRAGFPSKFLRTDWATPDFVKGYAPPESRSAFRDFRGLFLTGDTGRKKSASLCLMARDWLTTVGRRGSKAWGFVSFPELCLQLTEAWRDGEKGPMKVINRVAEIPLLIVDEVGAEKTSESVLLYAYLLFNKREQNELPTYGTSNISVDEIGEKLDSRIASRIRGLCHVIAVGGEDQRGRNA